LAKSPQQPRTLLHLKTESLTDGLRGTTVGRPGRGRPSRHMAQASESGPSQSELKPSSRIHQMGFMADLSCRNTPLRLLRGSPSESDSPKLPSKLNERMVVGVHAIWLASGLGYRTLADNKWGGCLDLTNARKENPNSCLAFQHPRVEFVSSHPVRIVLFLYDTLGITLATFYEVDGSLIPRRGIRAVYEKYAQNNEDLRLPKFNPPPSYPHRLGSTWKKSPISPNNIRWNPSAAQVWPTGWGKCVRKPPRIE
jgi:hypothetical protein